MKNRLSDENRICRYCGNATQIKETDVCVCSLIGAVSSTDTCRKFKLDPLKLDPRPKKLPQDGETMFFDI